MNQQTLSSLTKTDMEGAAYLCLTEAANTDIDQLPIGSGNIVRHQHHERKRRFERAKSMMEKGAVPVSTLGLEAADCAWAAARHCFLRDPDGWRSRFEAAENELRTPAK